MDQFISNFKDESLALPRDQAFIEYTSITIEEVEERVGRLPYGKVIKHIRNLQHTFTPIAKMRLIT